MEQSYLLVQLLRPEARMPERATPESAGLDVHAAEACVVPAGGRALVSTGLSVRPPEGTYVRVAPRSGLAVKHGIQVGAGVVDRDYTGEVGVLLFNHGSADFRVAVGDRIAQMVLERVAMPRPMPVDELPDSARGQGGFGSTGV